MNYYGLLMGIYSGGVSKKNFLRHHTEEELQDLLDRKFIIEKEKTDIGEPVYILTEKGREERDK